MAFLMKTSIATVSISGDLKEKLQAIAAAGFDGLEIFENDILTYGATAADARGAYVLRVNSSRSRLVHERSPSENVM